MMKIHCLNNAYLQAHSNSHSLQNKDNLLLLIDRKYKTRAEFCKVAGISESEFNKEIRSANGIKAETINKAVKALEIPPQEIDYYFFAPVWFRR